MFLLRIILQASIWLDDLNMKGTCICNRSLKSTSFFLIPDFTTDILLNI